MNKQDIYNFLDSKNIWHEITEHKAVFSMEEASEIAVPYPSADAKNIFVRDDKKQNYYLITVRGSKRVDLNKFRADNKTRRLTFASPDELMRLMELIPGAVTPFGILNDAENSVKVFLDKDFFDSPGLIGIHPNDNTATVWLKTEDLVGIIREHGNILNVIEI